MVKQFGWDVGGAHLKAVLLDAQGELEHSIQVPCPLWLGLDRLETAIQLVLKAFDVSEGQLNHAVTMTGELVDLFANRHDGVQKIAKQAITLLGDGTLFYRLDKKDLGHAFCAMQGVQPYTAMIASANWHASATLLAHFIPNALLIDIGSTTTDIIAISNGKIMDVGFTDAERMRQDTLVYTGVVRTPVMAVAQKLLLTGEETNVAAEYFATMADVYRLTGELLPAVDMADTADGEAKTEAASAKRLARMVGHDAADKPLTDWQQLAWHCREQQVAQIKLAVMKQLKNDMPIVGAGAGAFLAEDIAKSLGRPYIKLSSVFACDVDVCLPAYAVAKLAFMKGSV